MILEKENGKFQERELCLFIDKSRDVWLSVYYEGYIHRVKRRISYDLLDAILYSYFRDIDKSLVHISNSCKYYLHDIDNIRGLDPDKKLCTRTCYFVLNARGYRLVYVDSKYRAWCKFTKNLRGKLESVEGSCDLPKGIYYKTNILLEYL